MAQSLMIQGTCSNAGKSLLVTGLCRIYRDRGLSVAPFKAQNMALNSYVTADGLEMGRAQVTQAYACGKVPDVRMNPVLLKPSSDTGSQVIVMGKSTGTMNFTNYKARKRELRQVIKEAYDSLAAENDLIILEGAGSPAEVNLKKDDLVNMGAARMAGSPVLLAGDIDKGGVFASLLGTMHILSWSERHMVKGYIINKFRGDASLLESAFEFLKKKTGRPVLGVVPWLTGLNIPDEDSVEFKKAVGREGYDPSKPVNIALIDLPHISNITDFDPFSTDDDVHLYTILDPGAGEKADIIILPGSKNVIGDLGALRSRGMNEFIARKAVEGTMIIGICGGYQILGNGIADPLGIESREPVTRGLGLLDMETSLEKEKYLKQTTAYCRDTPLRGYEIHHGRSVTGESAYIINNDGETIGVRKGKVWGTYLHGIFDNPVFRRSIVNEIRGEKGLSPLAAPAYDSLDQEIGKLAGVLNKCLDMDRIDQIAGIG